jgi:aromatase
VDGAHVTTRMVRVCFPYAGIVYKQTEPPAALSAHVGRWQLHPTAEGVRVTAHNTVLIRPGHAAGSGRAGPVELTADVVRELLRKNCMAILLHAKNAASTWTARSG